jgi:acyl-CoA reductase-like NAD-dependent aldehyde dehydrogenase
LESACQERIRQERQEQAVQEKSAQWQDAVFVDGEFRQPVAKGTIGVRDKAAGEIFASAGLAGQADVDQAVPVAKQAQPAWSERTYAERAGLLRHSLLTGDPSTGMQIARRLHAGMVHVNDATPQDEALAPFGGIGQSGLGGRSGGDSNIEEFTERRWLTVNPGPAHYPY